jgi:hypothetical protein
MPYVTKERAEELDNGRQAETSGDLAYVLAAAVGDYFNHNGLQWLTISNVIGALEGVKSEVQDRIQRPYEDVNLVRGGTDPLSQASAVVANLPYFD